MSINRESLLCGFALGLLVSGCQLDSQPTSAPVGSISLAITRSDAVMDINVVEFNLSGNGYGEPGAATNFVQLVNVSASQTASAQIGGIPAGDNYLLSLNATSTTGIHCSSQGSFNVTAGRVSRLNLQLACQLPDGETDKPRPTTGSLRFRADVVLVPGQPPNVCPTIQSVGILPSEVGLGDTIQLVTTAADPDGTPLTYTWSELTGNPGFPTIVTGNSTASFTCTVPGTYRLGVTVSDGYAPCDAQLGHLTGDEQTITCWLPCVSGSCGNGAP